MYNMDNRLLIRSIIWLCAYGGYKLWKKMWYFYVINLLGNGVKLYQQLLHMYLRSLADCLLFWCHICGHSEGTLSYSSQNSSSGGCLSSFLTFFDTYIGFPIYVSYLKCSCYNWVHWF